MTDIIKAAIDDIATEASAADNIEMEIAYESVLDFALEADHVLPKEVRDALPDSAFGIPADRKFPLIVEGNPKYTDELVNKAIDFFHFAKASNKKELATNIVNTIKTNKLPVKISPKSQICNFADVPPDMFAKAKAEDKK